MERLYNFYYHRRSARNRNRRMPSSAGSYPIDSFNFLGYDLSCARSLLYDVIFNIMAGVDIDAASSTTATRLDLAPNFSFFRTAT